jgi:hypothetical protein
VETSRTPRVPAQARRPGQRVTWTRSAGYARTETRTGEIWSPGPLPGSVWAGPDSAPRGDMALVMLRNLTEHPGYPPSWQHDTVRRCEHLRRSEGIFAEYRLESRYDYGRGRHEVPHVVAYHRDQECPEIRHATRDCHDWEPTIGSVIRMMLDAAARGRSDLCRRCVYLSEPAAAASDRRHRAARRALAGPGMTGAGHQGGQQEG